MKKKALITLLVIALTLPGTFLFRAYRRMQAESGSRIEERTDHAYGYAKRKGFSTNRCIPVDCSIPGGDPSVFIWSFYEQMIVYKGHGLRGPGKVGTAGKPVSHWDMKHMGSIFIKSTGKALGR